MFKRAEPASSLFLPAVHIVLENAELIKKVWGIGVDAFQASDPRIMQQSSAALQTGDQRKTDRKPKKSPKKNADRTIRIFDKSKKPIQSLLDIKNGPTDRTDEIGKGTVMTSRAQLSGLSGGLFQDASEIFFRRTYFSVRRNR